MATELVNVGDIPRDTYIGGGDIAAILGISPYRTPLAVYQSKVGEAPPAAPDPKRDARLRRGKLWEPIVVEMLVEEHDIEVVARNQRYVDPAVAYFAAEIDFEWRQVAGDVVANGEIKSINPRGAFLWGEPETDEIPQIYAAQGQWGLMVTGRELCQYGVVFGADDLTLYQVTRDDDVIAWMREEAVRFWVDHVVPRRPPAPRTLADAARLWPQDSGRMLEATPEIAAMFSAWLSLKERGTLVSKAQEAIELEIADWLKDAQGAKFDGAPLFKYATQKTTSFGIGELAAAYPDVYKQFVRRGTTRVLRKARKTKETDDGE